MDNGFTREDYDETARAIKLRIEDPTLYADGIYPVMSNRVNVILGALDCASHLMRMREEWIAERERHLVEYAKCQGLLDGCGMPHEHHAEERPLSLDERIECLVEEYNDLQEGDDLIHMSRYVAAVNGRKEYREAYRGAREASQRLRSVLEELDAHLEEQVYGLRSGSPAKGIRDADMNVPADFEHDVLITEALWDKIRKALEPSKYKAQTPGKES